MKKKLIGVLLLAPFFLLFNTATQAADPNQKTTEEVLQDAFDKFGLVSSVIGKTDPVISIGLDDTRSEEKLKKYLDENLPPDAKEKYEVEIFKRNVEEMKKEIRENLKQEN
ncbi:hypothetical protein [Bacillus haynesii]|uniref:hypothetical protein n=1 Tax=Bacillus haynesii TaxID=1925021 RepID=UPI00227FD66B|nr:hypothetical protein [Bacillus haynesii]MCY7768628.1 hypothetical protein [Bacillus haynesii]MCY8013463.1 hypothetical protein [Bacillus haynesii]MCY8047237.1 hypothetical protein [Bacillus haynesii]MCY8076674.1 hypothetical protein [Bacillus haynesii]MCY8079497.1 hypothetical protein [Bacillus haynesii]